MLVAMVRDRDKDWDMINPICPGLSELRKTLGGGAGADLPPPPIENELKIVENLC